jgi:predicted regulator of Ras-like GTPase activity (Roadblock/LC7/MglB family)
MSSVEETLHSLRDVDGVQGSFVIAPSGALVAKDLPAIFDRELFSEVGPRIARLYESFLSGGEEMDACVLRYAEHKLYIRKMKAGLIATISASRVNMAALRMVVNLVIRRIDPEMGRVSSVPNIPLSSRTPPPSAAAQPASVGRPVASKTPSPPSAYVLGPVSASGPSATPSEEARDSAPPAGERQVRMYRGRPVED